MARRPELIVPLRPSRLGRVLPALTQFMVLGAGAWQSLRLDAPWPLLVALFGLLVLLRWRSLDSDPANPPDALSLDDEGLALLHGRRRMPVQLRRPAVVSALAIECVVAGTEDGVIGGAVDGAGGRSRRLCIWRDAVSEDDFRRLARRLGRATPGKADVRPSRLL